MKTTIRKETLIIRLWTDINPNKENKWRGMADFIGRGDSFQFQTIEEFIDWMRQKLEMTEEEQS